MVYSQGKITNHKKQTISSHESFLKEMSTIKEEVDLEVGLVYWYEIFVMVSIREEGREHSDSMTQFGYYCYEMDYNVQGGAFQRWCYYFDGPDEISENRLRSMGYLH